MTRITQSEFTATFGLDFIREGSAMLIEFDYDGNLTPSLPLIKPLNDSYLGWLLKYALLKPAYVATLKGHV